MALISNRYAAALFDLALEENCVDKYYDEVKTVYDAITSDKEIMTVLNHPQISSDEKLNMLKKAFSDNVSEDIMGLFTVIFKKNRESEIPNILQAFIKKAEDYKGIVYASVESATELSEQTLEKIVQKLSSKLNKQVIVDAKVSPQLLGGLKISVSGHVIDSTIKTQISELKRQLISTKLAQ